MSTGTALRLLLKKNCWLKKCPNASSMSPFNIVNQFFIWSTFYPRENHVFLYDRYLKRIADRKSVQMTNTLAVLSGCLLLLIHWELSQTWIICGLVFSNELQPSQFSYNQPLSEIYYWKLLKYLVPFVSNDYRKKI